MNILEMAFLDNDSSVSYSDKHITGGVHCKTKKSEEEIRCVFDEI